MRNWILVIIWAGLIFLGSCLPGASVSESSLVDFSAHKAVHILEYGVLAILLFRAISAKKPFNNKAVFVVLVICLLYGISDEFHQSFIRGREAKIRDVFIDLLGAGFGILLLWKLPQKIQKKLLN